MLLCCTFNKNLFLSTSASDFSAILEDKVSSILILFRWALTSRG
jgi:hypothetical protein